MAQERSEAFVAWVLTHGSDKGFFAKLRKADSEATAYQAWELLARWIDLEKPWERRAFSSIGASLTRTKTTIDGTLGIGAALRMLSAQKGGVKEIESSTEAARLRRLLSCRDQEEVIDILGPLLRHLVAKNIALSHVRLLDELLSFNYEVSQERTKLGWAKEFYQKSTEEEQKP